MSGSQHTVLVRIEKQTCVCVSGDSRAEQWSKTELIQIDSGCSCSYRFRYTTRCLCDSLQSSCEEVRHGPSPHHPASLSYYLTVLNRSLPHIWGEECCFIHEWLCFIWSVYEAMLIHNMHQNKRSYLFFQVWQRCNHSSTNLNIAQGDQQMFVKTLKQIMSRSPLTGGKVYSNWSFCQICLRNVSTKEQWPNMLL